MKKEFTEKCKRDVKEFTEKEGKITIEFSAHRDKLEEVFEVLEECRSPFGKWIAYSCETCEEYHGENFVHVSLEQEKYLYEFTDILKIQSKA